MEHSKKFEDIQMYYELGIWTKKMVKNAVARNRITAEEYEEITGDKYTMN